MTGPPVPSFRGLQPSSTRASATMRRNRRDGGRAERVLRSMLWAAGVRYRLHSVDLPGRPDIVVRSNRLVVFCDGDFWHGRNWVARRRMLKRGSNSAYWVAKIKGNRERDRLQMRALIRGGWRVIRLWETDVLSDPTAAVRAILAALDKP